MSYYDGVLYLTVAHVAANHRFESAVICYKIGGLGGVANGAVISPSKYLFDNVTKSSRGSSVFEIEGIDGYKGDMLFLTNEGGRGLKDSVRKYLSSQVGF